MGLHEIKALLATYRFEVTLRPVIGVAPPGRGWADHELTPLSLGPYRLGRVDPTSRHHRQRQLHDQRSSALRPRLWRLPDVEEEQ